MNFVSCKAIVLKTNPIKESDLVVTLLTEQGLKVSVIARGAKKSKKRFVGGIFDPTNVVDIVYREQNNPPYTVEEVKLVNGFLFLRQSYEKLMCAFHLVKLVNRIALESGYDQAELYKITGNALKSLETVTNVKCFQLHYMTKILYFLGVLDKKNIHENFLKFPLKNSHFIDLSNDEINNNLRVLKQSFEEFAGSALVF